MSDLSSDPQAAPSEPTTVEKLRGLRWNVLGDSANTVYAQFTFFGSVFILFLSELGLSKSQIGFMLSLLPFAGLVAPFIAPRVAQFGYKRTFITFWGARKAVTVLLLFVPWVLWQLGDTTALLFVGFIVAGFALSRAIAETGRYPWAQEFVPNYLRGKFDAVSNVFATITGLIAVAAAGFVLNHNTGLTGYMILIGAGLAFGVLGVWAFAHVPGGAPTAVTDEKPPRAMREALADRNYRDYLTGVALMILAFTPMLSFLPLYMQEQVGLTDSQVVLLQNGTLIGGLLSVFMWGWAADRFGSAPIMLAGIITRLLLPVFWMVMPRNSPWSMVWALAIAFFQGATEMAWIIGSARLLFVSIVPADKKGDYLALYYAWIGLIGGLSQLAGGWILQATSNLSGEFLGITIDPYTPLFLMGLVLPLIGFVFLRRVRIQNEIGVGQFAGIFFRGNPFLAVESMIRFHLAKDEQAAVLSTAKLGQARSLLTVEELLESLQDPRFNVRFEAIVAIGRTRPDAQLINALAEVLKGSDPALSVMAAWALGRMGSARGQAPLHEALDSGYRSIRAHSARSLATLGDESIIGVLRERLVEETDHGLRVAYAAALGQLGDTEVVPALLALLAEEEEPMARAELALALARLAGVESDYIHMRRQLRGDMDTAVFQILSALPKKWPEEAERLTACAAAFSQGQHDDGLALLLEIGAAGLERPSSPTHEAILRESVARLAEAGLARQEYLLLVLLMVGAAS
jgi:MFS family permease